MVVTRNQTAPEPLALFRALLHGNASMARRLLAGSGADQLALVAPLGNFTVLHAAVVGRAAAALPQLMPACLAAGLPLDTQLDMEGDSLRQTWHSPMWRLMRRLGHEAPGMLLGIEHQATALSIAVCYQDVAAIQTLLQAGARPAGSPVVAATVRFIRRCRRRVSWHQLLCPLLQHGLDPLAPAGTPLENRTQFVQDASSLLVSRPSVGAVDVMLAHLEAQRAAGSLQLGSQQRCLELLRGACHSNDPPLQLVDWGASQLQQLAGTQAAGRTDAAVNKVLSIAASAGSTPVLSALLARQLGDLATKEPIEWFEPHYQRTYSLLAAAAMSRQPTACMQLLYQAGAVPTTADLYCAIDELRPEGVAALLACGVPAIDTSQPAATAPLPAGERSRTAWSCPIHRALHALCTEPGWDHNPWEPPKHKAALQILEVLRAAGFRPTVYTDAALPDFARPSGNRVLLQLDLFDCYDVEWCRQRGLPVAGRYTRAATLPAWLLFAAQDGSWSPTTHHHWPDAFKAAARTLLLAANRSSGAGGAAQDRSSQAPSAPCRRRCEDGAGPSGEQQPGCTLGTLPPELLLRIIKAAAEPLSGWL